MTNGKDKVLQYLDEAHAHERALVSVLSSQIAMTPPRIQASRAQPTDPASASTMLGTRKMPAPMIKLTRMLTALHTPSRRGSRSVALSPPSSTSDRACSQIRGCLAEVQRASRPPADEKRRLLPTPKRYRSSLANPHLMAKQIKRRLP